PMRGCRLSLGFTASICRCRATGASIATSRSSKERSRTSTRFFRSSRRYCMARLIISSPDGKKGFLELIKAVTTMGRGNANDLVLNDPSVSRFHAVLKLKAGAVAIADRGSTNGIHLNGRRILQETELRSGDVARVGRYELRLENGEEGRIQV